MYSSHDSAHRKPINHMFEPTHGVQQYSFGKSTCSCVSFQRPSARAFCYFHNLCVCAFDFDTCVCTLLDFKYAVLCVLRGFDTCERALFSSLSMCLSIELPGLLRQQVQLRTPLQGALQNPRRIRKPREPLQPRRRYYPLGLKQSRHEERIGSKFASKYAEI